MRTNFPVVGVVFLLFGLVFGAVGGVLWRSEAKRGVDFAAADGTVTELEWSADSSRPVVAFTTAQGERRTVRGAVWSQPPMATVGEHLKVRSSASDAFIDNPVERWLLPGIFGGFGLVFSLIGAGVLALRRRAQSDKAGANDLRALAAARPPLDDFNVFRVVGFIFAPLGLAFLVGFGLWVRSELQDREGYQATRGTVVDSRDDSAGYTAPVVEFSSADGQAHRFTSPSYSRPPAYDKGEQVTVRYRVSKPADAHLDGFLEVWIWPSMLLVLGLVVGGLGGLLLFFGRGDG